MERSTALKERVGTAMIFEGPWLLHSFLPAFAGGESDDDKPFLLYTPIVIKPE